ncbi:MAG: sulfatase-like hydrolase/transferase [Gammaproteobacteria bacterium]|nr:sulfatase-like hydrolase/transferase [Gammaproteobacteria bacterium]
MQHAVSSPRRTRPGAGSGWRIVAAAALCGFAIPASAAAARTPSRPNIIWIMADDLGYADTGITGRRDVSTPHIDRIAKEGLFLTQSYTNAPVCSATRVGLITGRYQYRLRAGLDEPLGNNPEVGLPPSHPTLPSLLRGAGYRTVLVGKWHLGEAAGFGPQLSGYERFYGLRGGGTDYFRHQPDTLPDNIASALYDGDQPSADKGYVTDLFAQRAVQEIRAAHADQVPLFLSLHFTAPHWPWEGPQDQAISAQLTSLQHRDGGNLATYRRMLDSMDRGVGQVLATLDRLGLRKNTIVVFTSDNGGERFSDTWPYIGAKTELLEGGIHAPLFVRWPARIRAGTRSDQVNISMDWVPTLLAAAGVQPDPAYPSDGENLLEIIVGNAPVHPRQLYWRYLAAEQRALRDGDWKYLKLGKHEWLFNLAADEHERANLAAKYPERFAAMKQAWERWNATMLPYPPDAVSYGNIAADRY